MIHVIKEYLFYNNRLVSVLQPSQRTGVKIFDTPSAGTVRLPGTGEPTADAGTEAQAISSKKRCARPPRWSCTKEGESGESMLLYVTSATIARSSAPADEKNRHLWHHHARPD
ncbi:MAG: hypothetical protein V5B34_09610 [Accumulibacter sp.]|jgi:hypothetical protein